MLVVDTVRKHINIMLKVYNNGQQLIVLSFNDTLTFTTQTPDNCVEGCSSIVSWLPGA